MCVNDLRPPSPALVVNEIFHSIQGESTFAGLPCVFVRLTACDLRCTWCDTPYAFTEGRRMPLDEVVREAEAFGCPLVEVTGGEPLLQPGVYPLMERLLASGHTVLLETGGHVPIGLVPSGVVRVMDVKCPGSGEAHRTCWENVALLGARDEVKFVIADRQDYDYARAVVARDELARRVGAVLFSPVHGVLPMQELAAWMLADGVPARLQPQLHKYIWDANARGV